MWSPKMKEFECLFLSEPLGENQFLVVRRILVNCPSKTNEQVAGGVEVSQCDSALGGAEVAALATGTTGVAVQ